MWTSKVPSPLRLKLRFKHPPSVKGLQSLPQLREEAEKPLILQQGGLGEGLAGGLRPQCAVGRGPAWFPFITVACSIPGSGTGLFITWDQTPRSDAFWFPPGACAVVESRLTSTLRSRAYHPRTLTDRSSEVVHSQAPVSGLQSTLPQCPTTQHHHVARAEWLGGQSAPLDSLSVF